MSFDTYQTIARPSTGLYKDKGSKFLSYAFPVTNEEEIKVILVSLKKEHFSARHCCYAWSLGVENPRTRINDDGEPSGTAGRPIYGQILSNKLSNVLLVVVRYFGGTLLGVSGLIQAYKKAAIDVIINSEVVVRSVEHLLEIHFDYELMNNLMQLIKDEQLEIVNSKFDLHCSTCIKVPSARLEIVNAKLAKMEGVRIVEIIED